MGAARHGQGGARAPPPGNEQMGICYCYKLYVRVLESSITVLFCSCTARGPTYTAIISNIFYSDRIYRYTDLQTAYPSFRRSTYLLK